MDKLSGLASKLGGGSSNKESNSGSSGSAGQEDYLDKGKLPLYLYYTSLGSTKQIASK
jgi:hypothetical protein